MVKYLIKHPFILTLFILGLFIISHFTIGSCYQRAELNSRILRQNTTISYTETELILHNQALISTLQGREALDGEALISEGAKLWVFRGFCFTLIAGFLGLSIGKNNKKVIYFFSFFLIIVAYAIDIHINDLIIRSQETKKVTSYAIDTVISGRMNDWYNIYYPERDSAFSIINKNRLQRKFFAAFNPDIIQSLFYLLTLLIIIYFSLKEFHNKKFIKQKTQAPLIKH